MFNTIYNCIKINWYHKGKEIVTTATATQKFKYLDNILQRKWAQIHEVKAEYNLPYISLFNRIMLSFSFLFFSKWAAIGTI